MTQFIPARDAVAGQSYVTAKGRIVKVVGTGAEGQVRVTNEGGAELLVPGDYKLAAGVEPAKRAVTPSSLAGAPRDMLQPELEKLSDTDLLTLRHIDTRMWVTHAIDALLEARMAVLPILPELPPEEGVTTPDLAAGTNAQDEETEAVDARGDAFGVARREGEANERYAARIEDALLAKAKAPEETSEVVLPSAALPRVSGARAACPRCGKEVAARVTGHLREHQGADRRPCPGAGRTVEEGEADRVVVEGKVSAAGRPAEAKEDGVAVGQPGVPAGPQTEIEALCEAHRHVAEGTGSVERVCELLRRVRNAPYMEALRMVVDPILAELEGADRSEAMWNRTEKALAKLIAGWSDGKRWEPAAPKAAASPLAEAPAKAENVRAKFVQKPALDDHLTAKIARISAHLKTLEDCLPFVMAAENAVNGLAAEGVAVNLGAILRARSPDDGGGT